MLCEERDEIAGLCNDPGRVTCTLGRHRVYSALDLFVRMGATCPSCGSTNTHRVEVRDNGKVVRVYFECAPCGNVW